MDKRTQLLILTAIFSLSLVMAGCSRGCRLYVEVDPNGLNMSQLRTRLSNAFEKSGYQKINTDIGSDEYLSYESSLTQALSIHIPIIDNVSELKLTVWGPTPSSTFYGESVKAYKSLVDLLETEFPEWTIRPDKTNSCKKNVL